MVQDQKSKAAEEKAKGNGGITAKGEKKAKTKEALLAKAMKAYGIDEKYRRDSSVKDDGEVVILTDGGAKVRWREGDEVEPLDPIRVDGVIRKKMKPITGGKKK